MCPPYHPDIFFYPNIPKETYLTGYAYAYVDDKVDI